MIKDIDLLIKQMQKTKTDYPSLEIPEILKVYEIDAIRNLTKEITRVSSI